MAGTHRRRRTTSAAGGAALALWAGLATDAAAQGSAASDRAVLEALYHATGGPNWTNSTNWLSDARLEDWYGVRVWAGRVERLFLADNELSGPIPRELGQLTNLGWLFLAGNELSGPIPRELGQLTNLKTLELGDNELSGPIPRELGQLTNLMLLFLAGNELSGPIPRELGQLTNLKALELDRHTGLCLPPEIQDTVFGRLAVDNNNGPLCDDDAVTALEYLAGLVLGWLSWWTLGRLRAAWAESAPAGEGVRWRLGVGARPRFRRASRAEVERTAGGEHQGT